MLTHANLCSYAGRPPWMSKEKAFLKDRPGKEKATAMVNRRAVSLY
jgi:hypothetical protein